ncbi:hypothetical protein [Salarchaeum sp. JOR-1]|uniref:hypothetical protein n=1 Tax=Salarchaeum sp. JOR-1 TaxID=2599399 RepID=UPI001198B105|nr:hypothetical protein [Salarchaeum sp. JOR-1]QDX41599.1 hypothetical protein FQU85_12045 [Salarchaeum sp. JOR-1]
MYGVVTRNAEELDWPEFDRGFYEVKDVTGRHTDPVENGVNMVSCFGDTATAETDPGLVPVDDEGNRATKERTYFDWSYICPSAGHYKNGLVEVVEACTDANDDLRLDDVGFPRGEYCHCERCEDAFSESDYDDWGEWRASVITEFVAEIRDRVPGKLSLTLHPDPYPGHLYERSGLDIDALSEYVDEFVVPLYDTNYGTTYWLETIASGFQSLLDTPFSVELYAVDIDIDNLLHAAEVAEEYANDVFFGYHAGNARAALRRIDAETREGVEFGAE